jgi:hypothetical protein
MAVDMVQIIVIVVMDEAEDYGCGDDDVDVVDR